MSLRRFSALTATIRFDDRLTRPARQLRQPDKLAPIREVWDLWVAQLPRGYNPGENICVDEQLVGFHGRCSFRQYMPSKPSGQPSKYGLKLWVLADVVLSYAWGKVPYLGKGTPDAPAERRRGKRVVMELTEALSGGHSITTDNFFTLVALGEELLRIKMFLVRTIRCNKPELPPVLLQVRRRRKVCSSVFAFAKTTTTVSYVPKRGRSVFLISTKHRRAEVQEEQQKKPQVISYNRCKGAVDNLDRESCSNVQLPPQDKALSCGAILQHAQCQRLQHTIFT